MGIHDRQQGCCISAEQSPRAGLYGVSTIPNTQISCFLCCSACVCIVKTRLITATSRKWLARAAELKSRRCRNVYSTSHHDIAVINLSERALHYLFLLSNLFMRSHKLVCGCLQASWLITGLYCIYSNETITRLFEHSVTFQENIRIPKTTIHLSLNIFV